MTKNPIYWLLWIALAAISIWIVYSSSTFSDCLIEKNSGIGNIVSYRFRSVECSGKFLTQFANQIIALFTIVIAVGTIRLVTTARDTAQRQLRAYVGVRAYPGEVESLRLDMLQIQ